MGNLKVHSFERGSDLTIGNTDFVERSERGSSSSSPYMYWLLMDQPGFGSIGPKF